MRNNCGKKLLLALLSVCCINTTFAANNNTSTPSDSGASNAIAFAVQAGQIAGSAQGCGINISTFTTRVSEAINKLALNSTDSAAATSSFQQMLQQAQIAQRNNNTIPCSQVTQEFNNLQLLRPDYEQSVIAQLNPGMTENNQNTNTNMPTSAPAAASGMAGNNSATGQQQMQQQQPGMQNNMAAGTNMPNQQENLNNQAMPNTGTNNNPNNPANNQTNSTTNKNTDSNVPANPAYPQQNYGPMKSFSTTYPGAVKPYGMANMDNNNSAAAAAPAQQPQNNPRPPSFSNPNNAP